MEDISIWDKTNTLENVSAVIDVLKDITGIWRYEAITSETYAKTIELMIKDIQKEMEINIQYEQKTGQKI